MSTDINITNLLLQQNLNINNRLLKKIVSTTSTQNLFWRTECWLSVVTSCDSNSLRDLDAFANLLLRHLWFCCVKHNVIHVFTLNEKRATIWSKQIFYFIVLKSCSMYFYFFLKNHFKILFKISNNNNSNMCFNIISLLLSTDPVTTT